MPLCTWAHPSGPVHQTVAAHGARLQLSADARSWWAQRVSSALNMLWGSTAHRRSDGNKVNGKSTYKVLATCCYAQTSTATVGSGFSLVQRAIGSGTWCRSGQTTLKWTENLWARLLGYTGTPQVLGARRRNSPPMRSEGKSSHRWWVGVTHMVWGGRRWRWPMITISRARQPQGLRD
jgi:hypothetical protein